MSTGVNVESDARFAVVLRHVKMHQHAHDTVTVAYGSGIFEAPAHRVAFCFVEGLATILSGFDDTGRIDSLA